MSKMTETQIKFMNHYGNVIREKSNGVYNPDLIKQIVAEEADKYIKAFADQINEVVDVALYPRCEWVPLHEKEEQLRKSNQEYLNWSRNYDKRHGRG